MNFNPQNFLEYVKQSWAIDLLRELKLSHRIGILIAVFCVGIISFGLWSFKTLSEIKVGGSVYDRIEQSQSLIADVLPPPLYVIESYLVCLQIVSATPGVIQENLITRLHQLRKEYENRSDFSPLRAADGRAARGKKYARSWKYIYLELAIARDTIQSANTIKHANNFGTRSRAGRPAYSGGG